MKIGESIPGRVIVPISTSVELEDSLSLITGRNGAGKSRLLSHIASGTFPIELAGRAIGSGDILLIGSGQLAAKLNDPDQETEKQIQSIRGQMLLQYKNNRSVFDLGLEEAFEKLKLAALTRPSFEALYMEVQRIASKTNIKPSEVTHEELSGSLLDPTALDIGEQNLTKLYSDYVNRRYQNELNEFLVTRGHNVLVLSDDEFEKEYGPPPWIALDSILNDVFLGKFRFPAPDIPGFSREKVVVRAPMILGETGEAVDQRVFSSGERIIMWLAIATFNMQYAGKWGQKARRLLLLDEADAFLHPKMVRTLLEVLKRFHEQFGMATILVTHSPTTVALAPSSSTFLLKDKLLLRVSKDAAIAELLDGVSSISIDPENRRQVYTESIYDAEVLQDIYFFLKTNSNILESEISLTFSSSGSKVPEEHVRVSLKNCIPAADDDAIERAVALINGAGSCSQVIGLVSGLSAAGNRTVRGVIDWDNGNISKPEITVLGENVAYTIENILLDPLAISLWMHTNKSEPLPGKWEIWLSQQDLLQQSMDAFILRVLEVENKRDRRISYFGGAELLSDSRYLLTSGHELERRILKKIPELREICKGSSGMLKRELVRRIMLSHSDGKLIPQTIVEALRQLQA